MQPNYTKVLLDIEDVFIKKISHSDTVVKIHIETKPTLQTCPYCNIKTKRIHDYRIQTIHDLPFQLKNTELVLRKRRYLCTSCNKRFYEKYSFLARYQQRTKRLTHMIANELRATASIKSIATRCNVSTATVQRILDTISYHRPKLKDSISIDEFKGNAGPGKYQCILVNPKQKTILDILPDRSTNHLSSYFREIPRDERHRVKYFLCDMYQPYVDLAHAYFPNAAVVIDKYHFIRQVTWAIENVRKRLQKSMPVKLRKYYKRSRKLILTRYHKLKDETKKSCDLMLEYNNDLRLAHRLKEQFYEICQDTKYGRQREDFYSWIKLAESSNIPEFEKCAKTYRHWSKEILNAFKYGLTNGPTEGFNNKIKVLKRVSYGVRNFDRFRTRILHCTR